MNNKNKIFYTADEVAAILGVSQGHAYKVIRQLNSELSSNGYIVIAGKVSIKYFSEKYYGLN